ncbi:MAG: 50S ribosomal protein P1 [Candidatus Aenigmarchaeota archaeon]|nr:50S ribosomal protein P1 [Candidatus Aenigmarchaeota archaeon]
MGLEYIHAALLLHEAKKEIDEASVSKIIESVGLTADKAMIKSTVENLKEVNIEEVLSSAVAAPVAVAAAPTASAGGEEKKEEKKEEDTEKKAEAAATGLSSLFG